MISKVLDYLRKIGFSTFFLLLLYLTNPLNYGFLIGYLLIITVVLKSKFVKHNLDLNFLILLLFSLTYALFYALNAESGIQFIFVYAFTPPFLYLWGKYLAIKAENFDRLFYVIISMGTIFSLTALISVTLNIMEGGFTQGNRSISMFYNDAPINATGMAALFLFNMCIPAILLSNYGKIKNWLKIVLTIIFVLSIACILRLGSRTQLVVVLITFLITLFYVLPRQTFRQNLSLFLLLLIGVYFVFRNVSFDLNADWLTSFAGRMENSGTADIASGGGRTDRWVKSLEYLFEKPLGWDVKEFGYSHNLWLDVLRSGSAISFLILLIFSIKNAIEIKKVLRVNPKRIGFNMLLLTYFISFNLLFMVEPIFDGSFSLFVFYCLFMGIISQYLSIEANSKEKAKMVKVSYDD